MESSRKSGKYLFQFIAAMVAFGTIGIFRRFIPLDSGVLAMLRGLIGGAFIVIYLLATGQSFTIADFCGKTWIVIIIGAVMGFNWVTLFEAYNYTSVSTATLCYYMQPVFLILLTPVLFKEKLTKKKIICVIVAFIGMIFVSGILTTQISSNDIRGIVLGLASAVLYAIVVSGARLINMVDSYKKTALQLLSAGIVMIPYLAVKGVFRNPVPQEALTLRTLILVGIVCIVHTGIMYLWYFESINHLKMSEVAVLSYIDPVVAIILSQVILHESMGWQGAVGAVLILGAAFVSEKV